MTRVIAFTGKKRSGKTTLVVDFISKLAEGDHSAARINFKTALLEQAKVHFPDFLAKEAELECVTVDELLETKPHAIRQFLQNYGTDLFRGNDPNYWVKKWVESITQATTDFILVDDLRFMNEAAAVKSVGGVIIRIIRPSVGDSDGHASEMEMDLIHADYTIEEEDLELALHQSSMFLKRAFFESAKECTDQEGNCEREEHCRCVQLKK